jgi:hypothetical protein
VDVVWVVSEPVEILGYAGFELNAEDERAVLGAVLSQVWEVCVINDGGSIGLEDRNAGVEGIDFWTIGCALGESISRDSNA